MSRSPWWTCVLVSSLALFLPGRATAQRGACADASDAEGSASLSAAADSLFSLARERARAGNYVLVPFTRKPSALPSRGSVDLGALGPQQLERLSRGTPPLVAYLLREDGTPMRVEIVRSSGDDHVDQLVANSYRQRQFKPAQDGRCTVPFFGVEPFRVKIRTEVRRIPA